MSETATANDSTPQKAGTSAAPADTRNIAPQVFIGDVKSAGTVIDQLQHLATRLEARAIDAIRWYLAKKRWPQRLSQWVRGLAIALAILGGMMPLVSGASALPNGGLGGLASLDRLGYIFIASAAGIMLTDRYFGFSSAWMRYMTAQMALQRTLERFQLAWAVWLIKVGGKRQNDGDGGTTLSGDLANEALLLLSAFQADIGNVIDREFQLWVAEFKEQLANLQNALSKEKEDQRPGNIVVNIAGTEGLAGPAEIYLDARLVETTISAVVLLGAIGPGNHLLMVKAKSREADALECSRVVTVVAGQTSKVDVALAPAAAAQGL